MKDRQGQKFTVIFKLPNGAQSIFELEFKFWNNGTMTKNRYLRFSQEKLTIWMKFSANIDKILK